ncbi:MAG: AMP-binding protein, partial [Anaerolineae bacterium]
MSEHLSDPTVRCCTFDDLLRWRALNQPYQRAYTYLVDGETEEIYLSYAELDRHARAIGALLQRNGLSGQRALLLYPPGVEYIAALFGCLYAGVVAVPAYPPNPVQLNRTLPRLQAILNDAQPLAALTTTMVLSLVEGLSVPGADLKVLRWLATDNVSSSLAEEWREPAASRDTLAFLQYTSGSTSAPKGVMLTHGNLLHNSALIHRCFEHTPESQGVIWLPPYHDMGLIGGILQPLYGGFPVTLMSPLAFLQRPYRWLLAISRHRATTSGGPNFAYDLCVRKTTPEQRATLDLSSWEVAFNGSEPVRNETMERFATTFHPCGFRKEAFYPCYGLAEATLIVSGGAKAAPPVTRVVKGTGLEQNRAETAAIGHVDASTLVGCGRSLTDQQIVIADPETCCQCAPDEIGEIWVSGPSVAQGYWNRPDDTARTFQARLANTGEGPFLRTGDLGFLHEGELFVTGRLKDLIIIRGQNHYPQDIERSVEQSHPALRPGCGAAFSVEVGGEVRLVVVQEIRDNIADLNMAEIAQTIRQVVTEQHELQAYGVLLLPPRSIPKTSSGKIQRHACREAFLSDNLNVFAKSILDLSLTEAPSRQAEESFIRRALDTVDQPTTRRSLLTLYLQEQVACVLRLTPSQIDPQQPLNALGLDSLMAVEIRNNVEMGLGIVLPMSEFLQGASIAQIGDGILAQLAAPGDSRTDVLPIAAQEPEVEFPLSYGQRALWFLHQLAPESPAYNIAVPIRAESGLDVLALRRALQALVDRHPAWRTTFTVRQGELVQRVNEHVTAHFQEEDASSWSEALLNARLVEEAHRPFFLEQGPLLRVYLFRRSSQENVLLLVMHHIIADLWSLAVLVQELDLLYPAEKAGTQVSLPSLDLQYTDYVRWQAEMLSGSRGEHLWNYWRNQLAGELPVLDLPTDKPRPAIQTYCGASCAFEVTEGLTRQLKALARTEGATLYMVLLAAFQTLLYRYTGQEDILVGSPTTGRNRARLADVVGYFVNPVVLRADLSGKPAFSVFLKQVRQTVLAAFEHQDYPLTLLIERLQPKRDPSHPTLFQVMLVLQRTHLPPDKGVEALALGWSGAQMKLGDLSLKSIALEQQIAQFELTLLVAEVEERLIASLQYNTDLFETATINRMVRHFQTLLGSIVVNPDQQLAELPLLTQAERHHLLVEWNSTQVEY